MTAPAHTNVPRLAAGCRLSAEEGQEPVLLIPEGVLKLRGPGTRILQLCDGERTIGAIVSTLQTEFSAGDPARIAAEVLSFLEKLHDKRVLNY